MKKISMLLLAAFLCGGNIVCAQTPFNTMDSLHINNITPTVLVHGDMWWNPQAGTAACEFPSDSGRHLNLGGSLWISGYDMGNNLHIAAQTYRQNGNDYWPGPLDASGSLTYSTSSDWAKIWKVDKSTIDSFRSLRLHSVGTTPASILTWPGKGNTYAAGNGGAALSVTGDMAPFVDLNGNGIYEPLLGEYPAIPGEQALWWVFSDNGPTHGHTNGRPLRVEIHAMAYGYKRGTLIDNVVYYEYTIINKSPNVYSNTRFALWSHGGIGGGFDDYVGFDSSQRMGVYYSGSNDSGGGGHPINYYKGPWKMAGITMISLPGDISGSYVPAGSFTYFNNDNSVVGFPSIDTQYSNYMRAKYRNGNHFTKDFVRHSIPSTCYGAGADCNYVYSGDPGDTTQWSECNCYNTPWERFGVLSSSDFTFGAGTSQKIVLALVVADSTSGCPTTSFDRIKIVADTAWGFYRTAAVKDVVANSTINIYPNPTHDKIIIEADGAGGADAAITVFNTLGQMVKVSVTRAGGHYEANVHALAAGWYYVLCRSERGQASGKFLKE